MFDVLSGHHRDKNHVFGVTDDLQFARAMTLNRMKSELGVRKTDIMLPIFETEFLRFIDRLDKRLDHAWFMITVDDYRYEIRVSQLQVAVGGMSTLNVIT